MNVFEALIKRKSVRAFLDKQVEKEKINSILDAARHSPSGTNTQPWQVAIVTGESKKKFNLKLKPLSVLVIKVKRIIRTTQMNGWNPTSREEKPAVC